MKDYFVHESSFVDEGAVVGKDSKIWHFSHVMSMSRIGVGCIIGQNVFIASDVKIGDRVKVQNNVSIYKGVTCEDEVFIGPSVVFTNVINPRSFIERKDAYKPTLVKTGATIGANVTVICGNVIGTYAMVGAGAVVSKDIPAYGLAIGHPARVVGWVSEAGIKLDFNQDNKAICEEGGDVYILNGGIVKKKK
ncbi:N-acetyltransferase [Saprospiraceae bacterium]|nr:N-acetyltransferase [Saprospiraceae bacterium]